MHSTLSGPNYPARPPATPGQPVTVVRLRENGKKRRGPPMEGYLVLGEEPLTPEMPVRRARSIATLHRSKDPLMGSDATLFDPEIMRWDERGLILQGWEIVGDTHYLQVWLVTFGAAAPKFAV